MVSKPACTNNGLFMFIEVGNQTMPGILSGCVGAGRQNSVKPTQYIITCYSPAGRAVLGKTVPSVSSTARGRTRDLCLETSGTVFPNTDRPRPVNNIFIYF